MSRRSKSVAVIAQILITPAFELILVICDSRVKFKVSQTNIFQETKKSQIVIISRAQICTKNPQTTLKFYVKLE